MTDLTVTPRLQQLVEVSADGEVFTVKTPLVYTVHPAALQVVVPEDHST